MDESREAERALRNLAAHLDQRSRPLDPGALHGVRLVRTPTWRRAAAAAASVLVIAAAAFGLWAFARDGNDVDPVDIGPTTTLAPAVDGIRFNALASEGLAVWEVDGTALDVFDLTTEAIGELPVDPATVQPQAVQLALAPGDDGLAVVRPAAVDPAEVPSGCGSAVGVGGARIALCGDQPGLPDRIERIDALGVHTELVGSPPGWELGHWRWVLPSPDGALMLAQWSGECEVPTAWIVSTTDGSTRPAVLGAEVVESTALGWMPDGRALVQVHAGACGVGDEPGVYAVDLGSSTTPELLLPVDGNRQAALWRKTTPLLADPTARTFVRATSELGLDYYASDEDDSLELGGTIEWSGVEVAVRVATAGSGLPYVPFNDLVIESHATTIAGGPGTAGIEDTGSFAAVTCGGRVWTVTAPEEPEAIAALTALVPRLYCTLGPAPVATGHEDLSPDAHAQATLLANQFAALAHDPSESSLAAIPFADRVSLGLGPQIRTTVDRADLADPASWALPADGYAARAGTVSALELLASTEDFGFQLRPGACGQPGIPLGERPPEFDGYEDIAIQPTDITSCIQWFSITLYLDPRDGSIVGVVVSLEEP